MALAATFNRLEVVDVVVAAGVLRTAPTSTDVSFNPGEVVGVEIIIPDGHSGLTGIALAQAHQAIVPMNIGAFIIGNDEKIEWSLTGTTDTGDWQAFTFNEDVFVHTFHLRFLVDDLAERAAAGGFAPALQLAGAAA